MLKMVNDKFNEVTLLDIVSHYPKIFPESVSSSSSNI